MSLETTLIVIVLAIVVVLVVAAFVFRTKDGDFKLDIGGAAPRASGGSDQSADKSFKTRLAGLGVFSGGIIALLLGKLWTMQLVSSDEYSELANKNRIRTITTEAPRGRILDRNGTELVTNRPSLTVTASKDVANDEVEVQLLANLLGMPKVAVMRKIQDDTEGAQSYHTIASDVSQTTVAFIDEHSYLFDGVVVEERTARSYPKGTLAAQLLGYTGSVTQDYIDEMANSQDSEDAIDYELGDTVGQAGVEYQYESVLQGIRGEQTVYVDADGNVTDYSTSVEAQSGSDVYLTIDADIQQACEDGLKHAIEQGVAKGNKDCKAGACVVLDATNGEVLAMASAPSFPPTVFMGGISNDDWEAISNEKSGYPLMNRAIAGQYVSASTVKPLSAFSAFDNNIADASSSYTCTGYWTGFGEAYGQYCWNHNGHGTLNVQGGITYSCDVVFYEIGKAFYYSDNQEALQDTFSTWGLGKKTGIDLPGEAEGRVPTPEWKYNYFTDSPEDARQWQGGDMTNLVIGQGDLLVTPIQLACVYTGIANNGQQWTPHVLKSVKSHSGTGSVVDYKPNKLRNTSEKQEFIDLVKAGLLGVIYEEDANMASHFTNLSVKVAGKTGTGEVTGKSSTGWFCAYAPADDPKYIISCVVEEGGFGSSSAMYCVRDTLGGIYGEPDTSSATMDDSSR